MPHSCSWRRVEWNIFLCYNWKLLHHSEDHHKQWPTPECRIWEWNVPQLGWCQCSVAEIVFSRNAFVLRRCFVKFFNNTQYFWNLFVTVDRLAHVRKLIGRILENTMLFSSKQYFVALNNIIFPCPTNPKLPSLSSSSECVLLLTASLHPLQPLLRPSVGSYSFPGDKRTAKTETALSPRHFSPRL